MIHNLRNAQVELKKHHTVQWPTSPSSSYDDNELWLQQQDIASSDYPYIEPLIRTSFQEWLHVISDFPSLQLGMLAVFDYQGKVVATNQSDDQEEPAAAWNEQVMEDAISTKKSTVAAYEHATIAVPILSRKGQEVFAVVAYQMPSYVYESSMLDLLSMAALTLRNSFYRRFEHIFIRDIMQLQNYTDREARKKTVFFNVVQRIHGKFDVDSVLSEIIESIFFLYPSASMELYISSDHRSANEHVKPLILHNFTDDLCVRAFMEGRMIQEISSEDSETEHVNIAVPLSGKQGVYGVLFISLEMHLLEDLDFQLITMLADTAGTAFENAKLYEQSNMLIRELRLINELTKQLNQSLRLSEVFDFALNELLHIFKAEFCSILQLDGDKNFFKVMSSNVDMISKQFYSTDYGFSGLVYATKEPLILLDYKMFSKVRSDFMEETDSRSLMAVPLVINNEVNGAILLAHSDANYFSYDNFKLFQVLSTHIGLAIANASLHAKVQRMANHDNLTGLYARHYLDDRVHQKQKIDFCGSLIVVDIDHFKQINDTYGHQIGDKILRQVCEIIRSSIRDSDIAARWGGEELAIYLPQLSKSQASRVAERIRGRVEVETDPGVTVSCGISEWNWDDDKISVELLFYKADMALYESKNSGRNRITMD